MHQDGTENFYIRRTVLGIGLPLEHAIFTRETLTVYKLNFVIMWCRYFQTKT